MDVCNAAQVIEGVDYIVAKTGRLDVVVNNAGLGMVGPVESISDEEARFIFGFRSFSGFSYCSSAKK